MEVAPVTAEEALAEIDKVNELLRELDAKLRLVPSWALPQLQQEIAEAMARKGWLFEQILRMEKAGALKPTPPRRKREVN
jgi:hypothetical protein